MKAAEVYRVLRGELAPWLQERQFKRQGSSGLVLVRALKAMNQVLWFQCDRRGWDPYAGSSFFVNLGLSPTPVANFDNSVRLNELLTDDELALALDYHNAIVQRLRPPPESYFTMMAGQFSRYPSGAGMLQALRDQFQPRREPFQRNQDFSLRYYAPGDVAGWAQFMKAPLDRAFAQTAPSGQGGVNG